MRLLLDGRKIGDGGIGVYLENLVDGLLALSARGIIDIKLSLLIGCPPEKIAAGRTLSCVRLRECLRRWNNGVRLVFEPAGKYSMGEYLTLARRQKRELKGQDVFHAPHYTLPYFLDIPAVVTVHDVIHVSHPQTFYHRPMGRRLIRSAVSRASAVITVSEESKLRIAEIAGSLSTPISVVPNALRLGISRREPVAVQEYLQREFLSNNYCLFVGSDRPHKGFPDLLRIWAMLRRQCADRGLECPELMLVGRSYGLAARQEVEAAGLQGNFRFLGDVSVDKLSLLYSGARAVLMPSRVEGFGLPALEAMACGAPVVCSPIAALQEVCGTAAEYGASPSVEAFSTALARVLFDESAATRLCEAGQERSQRFSLHRHALLTWNVYQAVLGEPELGEEVLGDLSPVDDAMWFTRDRRDSPTVRQ